MKQELVIVKNVSRLIQAGDALLSRGRGLPGMGLVHGRTGEGKTTAVRWWGVQKNAVFVRATALWTPSSMLASIARELDIGLKRSNAEMLMDIIEALAKSGRPLVIDEADYLADSKRLTETARDIHDLSSVPVILIGMSELKHKLKKREQLTGRIAQEVQFRELGRADVRKMADTLCEVEIADDLVDLLADRSTGAIRLVAVGLYRLEQFARNNGKKSLALKDWPAKSELFTGNAPAVIVRKADSSEEVAA